MQLERLGHYSIRTRDLESSLRFYTEVLGLRAGARPSFDFPGHWLYLGDDESTLGLVHLVGVDDQNPEGLMAYLGDRIGAASAEGSGALAHVAFFASGRTAWLQGLRARGISFSEREVPAMGLHQVFLRDPDSITIEMNFPAAE